MANAVSQSRPMSLIHGISLNGIGTVIYAQGPAPNLTVTAEPDAMPMILTEIRDGTLHIDTKLMSTSVISFKKPPVYTVTSPTLTDFSLNGAGKAVIGPLETRSLDVAIDGAGEVKLADVSLESFRLDIRGAGTVSANGSSADQDILLRGTGNFTGHGFRGQRVRIQIPGAGRASVNAADTLSVEIDGVGTVSYVGEPSVTKKIGGLGVLKQDRKRQNP